MLKANAKRGTKEFVQYSGARTEGRAGAEVTVRLAPRARRLARTGCSADMAQVMERWGTVSVKEAVEYAETSNPTPV